MKRASFSLVVLALLASCAVAPATVSDRLFCGRSTPGGVIISDAQLEVFLAEVVEPRFPDGFTVWQAEGAWRGGREDVLVLEIVHRNDPRHDRLIREIAEEYRSRFKQEAVLRVTTPASMSFTSHP